MTIAYRLLLLWCAVAGAGGCHRSESVSTDPPLPERRSVQRSAIMAGQWQIAVCTGDARVLAFADSLAASRPGGKTLAVCTCQTYDKGLPTLFLGDHLPAELITQLPANPVFERLRQLGSDDIFTLSNFLNPLTVKRSMPTVFTCYLSLNADILLGFLQQLDLQSRGSIFRNRWAYEWQEADGGRTMGTFAEHGWDFALSDEVHLPPLLPVAFTSDSVQYFAVDGALSPGRLVALAALVERELRGESPLERVYIYPSVERIGLRRGIMEVVQRDGVTLHMVDTIASGSFKRSNNHHPFLAGMTLAHEGYRVYNGYGGSGVAPSLDSLRRMNVNAVAVVPYTYLRQSNDMQALPIPEDAGSENDPAVRHAIRRAKERGMFVLLKPQIWVGGGWPGDVNFEEEADWELFFREYGAWISHYAAMAEEEGVEALCIGTELVHTTLTHPAEWRTLIAQLRTVYRGQLTYAANWGNEFEHLTFWEDLDAMGLNSYYPLAMETNPSDATLAAGAKQWMQRADSISVAYDRPLWLTEVGYRSVQNAWTNPHAEAGDRGQSYVDQARCYRALLSAANDSERLEGMFLWKWPSYLGHQEGRNGKDTGYVPGGKPAGELLRQFFGER